MIDTKALRQKILDMAIHGQLVPQDPTDEPASVLLEKIRAEKQRLIKEGKIKKDKSDSVIYKGDDNRYYEHLPSGWVEIQLSLICWIEDGEKKSGENLTYWDAKAFRGKAQKEYINSGKVVEQNSYVILVDGENSGEVFFVPYKGYLGSTFKVLSFSHLVNVEYIKLILGYHQTLFRENKTGSAIPHLNKKLFRTLPIILPPLFEQSRIVSNVKRSFRQIDIIENNQANLEQLYDDLKKKTLDLAIRGKLVLQDPNDEPASELLKRIRAEKKAQLGKKYVDSYIYKGDDNYYYEHIDGKAKDEVIDVPFGLPDNWVWVRIPEITYFQEGPGIMAKDFRFQGIPLIRIAGMQTNKVSLLGCNYLDVEMVSKKWNHFRLDKGDIVVSTSASMGKIAEVYDDTIGAIPYTGLIRFKMNKGLVKSYFKYFMQSNCYAKQIDEQKSGTTIQHYGPTHIQRMIIPIPPINEQQRIVDKIDVIFANL